MVMVQNTLATELENLVPVDVEADAAAGLTDAYGVFASGAAAGAVAITPAGVELGKAQMLPALTGMSAPGAGLAAIPAGIIAFWVGVAGGLAASFPGAIAVVPPPNAALAAAFAAMMPANTAAELSLADAAAAMAGVMYANAIVGGLVTLPGVPPLVFPIL